jgi:hypothetical protein
MNNGDVRDGIYCHGGMLFPFETTARNRRIRVRQSMRWPHSRLDCNATYLSLDDSGVSSAGMPFSLSRELDQEFLWIGAAKSAKSALGSTAHSPDEAEPAAHDRDSDQYHDQKHECK